MNLEAVPNKIMNIAETNAALLTFGLSSYARYQEAGDGVNGLISYLTFQRPEWTPASEIMHFLGAPIGANASTNNIKDNIMWKFWNAPHLNTQLFKYSAIAYAAGKYFGLFGGKWLEIAKNVAIGAGLSALILPSSDPASQAAFVPNGQAGSFSRPTATPTAGTNQTGGKVIGY